MFVASFGVRAIQGEKLRYFLTLGAGPFDVPLAESGSTALGGPQTPPRKAPARDKLKPLAMPKALKI